MGRLDEFPEWHHDVALELWVDAERSPVQVRLAGTLDEATSPSLLAVVADLLGSGVRQFEFVTDGLRTVEPGGSAALEAVAGMVERWGGTVRRLPPHAWSDASEASEASEASGPAAPAGR